MPNRVEIDLTGFILALEEAYDEYDYWEHEYYLACYNDSYFDIEYCWKRMMEIGNYIDMLES